MKLLFDQNLSFKLVALLAVEYPKSQHVLAAGLDRAADGEVWAYASNNGLAVVSKDVDFQRRALLRGPPPKVVWLRLGNCHTQAVVDLLRSHQQTLNTFDFDAKASFIALI